MSPIELPIHVATQIANAKKDLGTVKQSIVDIQKAEKDLHAIEKITRADEKKKISESNDALAIMRHRHHELTEEIGKQKKVEADAANERKREHEEEKRRLDEKKQKLREVFDHLRLGAGAVSGPLGKLVSIVGGLATGGKAGLIELGMSGFETGVHFLKHTATELYTEGRKDYQIQRKLERQYGTERGKEYLERAEVAGGMAGVERATAAQGFIKILEAMPAVAEGTVVTAELAKQLGLSAKRQAIDAETAERLRADREGRAFKTFERFQTLRPDIGSEQIGRIVGALYQGMGARKFVMEFGLPLAAQKIVAANEAGKLTSAPGLGSADLAGIKLKNGRAAEGDLIELLSKKYDLDEAAAEEKRREFGFQIESIKATFGNVFSEIGQNVFEKLNGPLKEGKTIAQEIQEYVKSPEGKKKIEEMSTMLGKVALSAGELAKHLPSVVKGMADLIIFLSKLTPGGIAKWLTGGHDDRAKKELEEAIASGKVVPEPESRRRALTAEEYAAVQAGEMVVQPDGTLAPGAGAKGTAAAAGEAVGRGMVVGRGTVLQIGKVDVASPTKADWVAAWDSHIEPMMRDHLSRETAHGAAPGTGG